MGAAKADADNDIVLFSSKSKRRKPAVATPPAAVSDCADDSAAAARSGGDASTSGRAADLVTAASPSAKVSNAPAVATAVGDDLPLDSVAAGFRSLGVSEWLDAVLRSLGITKPTDVQTACIPAALAGRDVIGVAHTGSGKTAAFALPILQQLARDPFGVFALVLTPTRELAVQIGEQFAAFGAGLTLKQAVVIGGGDAQAQARQLAARPHVVVATPGRLWELLTNNADLAAGFKRVRCCVLDEADRLLDKSFEPQLRGLLPALPPDRQTLLFSATMTQSLLALQKASLRDAHVYEAYSGLVPATGLREQYCFVPQRVKDVYLVHLLRKLESLDVRSAIVFVGTCKGCHLLSLVLQELQLPAVALHSALPQAGRTAALQRFKSGAVPLLLATDVASRGLDIPTVDLVINYDLPVLARDYVHRVGRTARAGRSGWALSMVTQYDVDVVHTIEALTGRGMAEWQVDEGEVLKGIGKVYAAKKAAGLRMIDEEASGRTYRPNGWRKRKQQADART